MDGREHFYGGAPLDVNFNANGLNVNRNWNPESAYPNVGAGLEVVSKQKTKALLEKCFCCSYKSFFSLNNMLL